MFMKKLWDLVHEIHMCKLTDNQMGILAAIVLMSRDRPGLIEPVRIDEIQEQLIRVLQELFLTESCSNDSNLSIQKLKQCLKFITPIQRLHREHCIHVANFRTQYPVAELPALYRELFNRADYISVNLQKAHKNIDTKRVIFDKPLKFNVLNVMLFE